MNFFTNFVTRTIPIGSVIPIPLYFDNYDIDIDSMFLDCDGSALLKSDYPYLFAIIGIEYGESDGGIGDGNTDYFLLPDYKGLFLRNENGIRSIGYYQPDSIVHHIHTIIEYKNDTSGTESGVWAQQNRDPSNQTYTAASYAAGGSETRPKNVYARYCVRYR